MATRPKSVIESHDGKKFSPITIAKNVLTDDGQNLHDILSDRKEDMMTPTIENSSSMSKVGQGDNVDFSDNVMNGAYEDVVLKGKSLVNVVQGSSKDKVVPPYSFEEGEMVTINDTHPNGRVEVEVRGRTLVNLASPHEEKEVSFIHRWQTYALTNDIIPTGLIEGELIYMSMEVNIHEINIETSVFSCQSMRGTGGYGLIVKNFDELEQLPKNTWVKISTIREVRANQSLDQYNLQLGILGEHPTESGEQVARASFRKPMWINLTKMFGKGKEPTLSECDNIPYFEGMTSVQTPTVQTCGKNLFNPNNIVIDSSNTYGYIDLSKHETLTFSITDKDTSIDMSSIFFGATYQGYDYDGTNQNGGGWLFNNGEFVRSSLTTTQCKYFSFHPRNKATFDKIIARYSIQIEEGSTATTYERYQSSTLILPEEVILRGLPNGVCDTYNTKTKEYTQRIGEVVLDGSEDEVWYKYSNNTSEYNTTDKTSVFNISVNGKKLGYNTSICDTFKNTGSNKAFDMKYVEPFTYSDHPTLDNCYFDYGSNNNYTLNDFKVYLQQKPITVQYELATPIITKIDLPSLKAYNTITHLSSTVGEGSLVPTLASDHTVDYPVVIKPNTKYSIIANHRRRGDEENPISFNLGGANSTVVPGERVTTITTPSTLTHSELRVSGRETQISDVMVIEGEVNRQVPYFEGIGDCKSPILKSVGKNLFDINGEFTKCSYSMGIPFKPSYDATSKLDVISPNEFVITTPNNSYNDGFGQYIDVSGVDEVTVGVTALFNHSKTNLECKVMFLRVGEAIPTTIKDRDELLYPVTTINVSNGDRAELTLRTRQYARVFIMLSGAWKSEMSGTCSFTIKDVYVGANEEYEPYKSNTTTFTSNDDEIIVLRSLPNGVCDTLNVRTGEYVQNIGEITLDGTKRDDLVYHTVLKDNDGDFIRMIINGCSFYDNNKYGNCDKLPFYHEEKTKDSVEAVFPFAGEKHFYIKIKTSRINGAETMENNSRQLRDAFLNWLAQNPITVQYELATPTIKQVNVEGYPYAYENGHVLLESGSIEQSLTPTVEYSIVANRGGQIRSNQRMVERQQKELDRLQTMVLVNLVNTRYEQTLTNLKYDLKNVREEVK